jgi:uncharacterized membrane protein
VVLVAAGLSAVGMAYGPKGVAAILGLAFVSFVSFGRTIVVFWPAMEPETRFQPWELALMVLVMDLSISMFVVANAAWLHRVPRLGPLLESLEEHGRRQLAARPWLRRGAWLGLALFVLLPVSGTGAVGGSLLGRLLGMRPWAVVSAVAAGAVVLLAPLTLLGDRVAK